jgi:hypothetical protein
MSGSGESGGKEASDKQRKSNEKKEQFAQSFQARKRIDEKASPERKKQSAEDSSRKQVREAGKKLGEAGAPPEKPKRQTRMEGIRNLIDDVHIDTLLSIPEHLVSDTLGLAKTAFSYITKIGEAMNELHRANTQSARREGITHASSILWGHQRSSDNAHITSGKPYSGEELHKEVRQIFGKQIDQNMRFLQVGASGASEVHKDAVHKVANHANEILKKGKTPDERRALMHVFVKSLQEELQESYRHTSSPSRR